MSYKSIVFDKTALLIISASLFTIGLNIPLYSPLILLIMTAFLIYILGFPMKFLFLINLLLIYLFSIIYFVFVYSYGFLRYKELLWIAGFCLSYTAGYLLAIKNKNNTPVILIFLMFGMTLYSVFSIYAYNYLNYGLDGIGAIIWQRSVPSIWNLDGELVNAPALGVFLSTGICLISIIFTPIKYVYRLGIILMSIVACYASVILQTRGPIYAGMISFIVGSIIYFNNGDIKKRIIISFFYIIGIPFFVYYVSSDDNIYHIRMFARFTGGLESIFDTGRYETWLLGFRGIIEHPLGGGHTSFQGLEYAHNILLDIGNLAGVFPMILLATFYILNIKNIIYIFKCGNKYSYIIASLIISILVSFTIEPIPAISLLYFAITFMIFGAIGGSFSVVHKNLNT